MKKKSRKASVREDAMKLADALIRNYVAERPCPGLTEEETVQAAWALLRAGLIVIQVVDPDAEPIMYRIVPALLHAQPEGAA